MKAMLTSSLGGSSKVNGMSVPSVLIQHNGLLDNLKSIWKPNANVLIICAIRVTMKQMIVSMLA